MFSIVFDEQTISMYFGHTTFLRLSFCVHLIDIQGFFVVATIEFYASDNVKLGLSE